MTRKFIAGAAVAAAFIALSTPGYARLSLGGNASGGGSLDIGIGVPSVDISGGARAGEDVNTPPNADSRLTAQADAQAGAQTNVDSDADTRVRKGQKFESGALIHGGTINTNTTVTTETRESIDAGRSRAKKRRARPVAPPSQHEIHDRSTGLQNRADAGAGAVGGVTVNSNAAFSMGARQKTDFNQ